MKQIKLLLLALLFAITAQAQTYDDRLKGITGIKTALIQPISISIWDSTQAIGLGVKSVDDNFSSYCIVYYQLVDSNGHSLYQGNVNISGADYQNWDGDNDFPFTYTASKLKLTLK